MTILKQDARSDTDPGAPAEPGTWISKTPGVCGGQACIRNTRITVWGLVLLRRSGLDDAEIMREIEGLTPGDLAVAWEYAEHDADEIEAVIRMNEEA